MQNLLFVSFAKNAKFVIPKAFFCLVSIFYRETVSDQQQQRWNSESNEEAKVNG